MRKRYQAVQFCREVRWKLDTRGASYGHRLKHQFVEESAHVLILADDTQWLASTCGHTGVRRQQYEFLPDIKRHVIAQRDVDARIVDLLDVVGQNRIRAPIHAAAPDFRRCASLTDDTRLRDCDNMRCPANRGVIS